MRAALLSLALLASSCAGTCSAVGGGSIGYGAIGSGSIGNGAIGGQQATADTCDPFGSPDLAFMGCNVDGSNNTTLANNDPVCTWHDSGSLGVDATQGTGTACPTFVASGGPNGTQDAVSFDGGDYLRTAALGAALAQPNVVAGVWKLTTTAGSNFVYDASPNRQFLRNISGGADLYIGAGSDVDSGQNFTTSAWHATQAVYDGAASSLRLDGSAGAAVSAGTSTLDALTIGASSTATLHHDGSIADVIVYDTPPTATDVEADLATHHASTFPVAP